MSRVVKINGLPVKDARKSIVIHVTTGDVKKGKRKGPESCAAALACQRELGATEARVHISRTYLRFNGHWGRYRTEGALRDEIIAFDRGGKFEAGTYRLMKMQPSRQGDVSRGNGKKGASKRRRKYHILSNVRPIAMSA